jgi:hypothetical protein
MDVWAQWSFSLSTKRAIDRTEDSCIDPISLIFQHRSWRELHATFGIYFVNAAILSRSRNHSCDPALTELNDIRKCRWLKPVAEGAAQRRLRLK